MRASILCLMLFVAGADLAAAEETPVAAADDWNRTLRDIDALFAKFAADTHAPGLVSASCATASSSTRHWRTGPEVESTGHELRRCSDRVDDEELYRAAVLKRCRTRTARSGRARRQHRANSRRCAWRAISVAQSGCAICSHTAGFVTDDPWGDRQSACPSAFSDHLRAGIPLATSRRGVRLLDTGYANPAARSQTCPVVTGTGLLLRR
jgi:hypothetical protein